LSFSCSFGRKGCGRKLKHVELSGCVHITDVTLQRLSSALGNLPNIEVANEESKTEKNEVELNEKEIQVNKGCSKCKKSDGKKMDKQDNIEKNYEDKGKQFQPYLGKQVTPQQPKEKSMFPSGNHEEDDSYKSMNDTPDNENVNNGFDNYTVKAHMKTLQHDGEDTINNNLKGKVVLQPSVEKRKDIMDGMYVPVKANVCADKEYSDLNHQQKPCIDKDRIKSVSSSMLTLTACDSSKKMLSDDAELVKENCLTPVFPKKDEKLTYYESKKPKRTCGYVEPILHCANTTNCDKTDDVSNFDVISRGLEYLSLSGCYHITNTGLRYKTILFLKL